MTDLRKSKVSHACLWVALVWGAACPAFAATEFSLGQVTGQPGSTVSVPLNFSSSTPVVAAQFEILFDPARLSAGPITASGPFGQVVDFSTPSPGLRRVVVYSLINTSLDPGLLLNVPFTVLGAAPEGTAPLRLANVLAANAQANPVQPLTLRDGAVIISSALPAQFVSIIREGSSVRLRLTGTEARSYVIQRSSDLITWLPVSTNTVVGGAIEFTQPTSANTQRFYRAVLAQ